MKKLLVLIFCVVLFGSNLVFSAGDCKNLLERLGTKGPAYLEIALAAEDIPLSSLLELDPAKNLAVKHPLLVMNAAQKFLTIINHGGKKMFRASIRNGKVPLYPLLSEGLPVAGNKMISGNVEEIARAVDAIKNNLYGSSSVPFFQGPHGTGKSLILDIFRNAIKNLSIEDPKFYFHTFEWVGLDEIKVEGVDRDRVLSFSMSSPIVILPPEVQQIIVKFAGEHFPKEWKDNVGVPLPVREPRAKDQHVLTSIMSHYLKKGEEITALRAMEILDKHVRIKRVILGTKGTVPVVDAQSENFDKGVLFFSKNMYNYADLGAGHVMSWNDGIVPRADGLLLILDEFPRNPSDLRDLFLRIFESREIITDAPPSPFDAVIIGAGNTASINDMIAQPKGQAHYDRLDVFRFPWNITPQDAARTLLIMANSKMPFADVEGIEGNVAFRELSSKKPSKEIRVIDIFPNTEKGDLALTSDYRYEVSIGRDKDKVYLNPHTLMFYGYVLAASRISTDATKAGAEATYDVINRPVFRDYITRLKYLTGDYSLEDGVVRDLEVLSDLLKEGETGITQRDAFNWLKDSINFVRKNNPDGGGVLTVETAHNILKRKLAAGEMQTEDAKDRVKWDMFAEEIKTNIVYKNYQRDVNKAVINENSLVSDTYIEVLNEIMAMQKNPGAATWSDARGDTKTIDLARLQKIKKIYQEEEKEAFQESQIGMFGLTFQAKGQSVGDAKHPGLINAIRLYYANEMGSQYSLQQALRAANGSASDTQSMLMLNKFYEGLTELGYRQEGALHVLQVVDRLSKEGSREAQGK